MWIWTALKHTRPTGRYLKVIVTKPKLATRSNYKSLSTLPHHCYCWYHVTAKSWRQEASESHFCAFVATTAEIVQSESFLFLVAMPSSEVSLAGLRRWIVTVVSIVIKINVFFLLLLYRYYIELCCHSAPEFPASTGPNVPESQMLISAEGESGMNGLLFSMPLNSFHSSWIDYVRPPSILLQAASSLRTVAEVCPEKGKEEEFPSFVSTSQEQWWLLMLSWSGSD